MSSVSLLLASQSPRRRELLQQIGVAFDVVDVDVPEVRQPHESAEAYVCRLATDKANAGAAHAHGLPVLGADTLGLCQGEVLEKPRDRNDYLRMLNMMSGRSHQVLSAVCLRRGSTVETRLSVTEVQFRQIAEQEMLDYWATGEPQGKAGGYAIQGFGAVFVERISGSYSGVVGLPLCETQALLHAFNVPLWQHVGR